MTELIKINLKYKHSSFFNIEELKNLNNKVKGLYFLYNKEKEIIYIGKAKNSIKNRLNYHLKIKEPEPYDKFNNQWKLHIRKKYKYFTFIEIETDYIDITEVFMIKKYTPKYNIEFNEIGKLKKEEFKIMYNKNNYLYT